MAPSFGLPLVRSLEGTDVVANETWRPVHGDVSTPNTMLCADGRTRLLDFDECGIAPDAYDLAASIYVVTFDGWVSDRPGLAGVFRAALVRGYVDAGGTAANEEIDALIERRLSALARWLDRPGDAPIGIRTSSADWLATLGQFVAAHSRS